MFQLGGKLQLSDGNLLFIESRTQHFTAITLINDNQGRLMYNDMGPLHCPVRNSKRSFVRYVRPRMNNYFHNSGVTPTQLTVDTNMEAILSWLHVHQSMRVLVGAMKYHLSQLEGAI